MRTCIFLLAALLCRLPLEAQKRPCTIADLYRIKNTDEPRFSPDGKHIAFVLKEDDLARGTSHASVYIMDADGHNVRSVATGGNTNTNPRWSPDGSSLLFLSDRSGSTQAWVLELTGGEPRQLTDFPPGVAEADWAADGKRLVFASDVYPECGADGPCNKRIEEQSGKSLLKAHMSDHLLYRHWTSWKDGTRTHIILFDIAPGVYSDLTPGDFDAPPFSLLGPKAFALSPEGSEICFSSNHDTMEARSTNVDLFLAQTRGGAAVNITSENAAYDGDPAYSPDGRYIAYRMQRTPGYESDRYLLVLYDRRSHEKRVLSEKFDYWVNDIRWAPDSRSIYFTSDVHGHVPLYRADVASGAISEVVDVKVIDAFDISADGSSIAFVRRSVGEPREIWSVPVSGKSPRRLTFFNEGLEKEVDFRPAEEIFIPSPSGVKIQTFIVTPHNFDPRKKYPLILNVHGGPQQEWTDSFRGDWQVYPGAGYVVAFPNPHGSNGGGQEFVRAISEDWAGRVYDDLMAVTDSLERLPYVDASRIGAMGWSYGGYMMMWLEGHTRRFKAIASMMGVYDLTAMHGATEELWFPEFELGGTPWSSSLYRTLSPNASVKNFGTPCLVITGERDYRVPYTQSLEFFTDLQEMHVPSRLIVFSNDGHWPSAVKSMPFYYNAHLDWFHTYLGGDPAPYDMTVMLRGGAFERR